MATEELLTFLQLLNWLKMHIMITSERDNAMLSQIVIVLKRWYKHELAMAKLEWQMNNNS